MLRPGPALRTRAAAAVRSQSPSSAAASHSPSLPPSAGHLSEVEEGEERASSGQQPPARLSPSSARSESPSPTSAASRRRSFSDVDLEQLVARLVEKRLQQQVAAA
mmetsp:Transcript_2755/g.8486  ORF Transcript_2755/g.8486 Transcript_2755/m.8486 type:complete len:106 (+) Transcript_2755:638-955(+)